MVLVIESNNNEYENVTENKYVWPKLLLLVMQYKPQGCAV